jgi:ribosomal protein S26
MSKKIGKQGFTVIEIVVYFGIFSGLILAVLNLAIPIFLNSQKSDILHDLQANLDFVVEEIFANVRIAESINTLGSTFDDDNGVLAINTGDIVEPSISYDLQNGRIYKNFSLNPSVAISPSHINCSVFRFQHVTNIRAPDLVIFNLTCESFDRDLSLQTSISLRK